MSIDGTIQHPPYTIPPRELVCFVIAKYLQGGMRAIPLEGITAQVPALVKQPRQFSLPGITCAELPGRRYQVPEVEQMIDYLKMEGHVLTYNPTLVTRSGERYCSEVVEAFRKKAPDAAKALASAIGYDLAS